MACVTESISCYAQMPTPFFRNFNSNFTLKQNIGLTSVLNIAESSEVKNALKTGNRDLAIHYLGVSK